MRPWHSAAARCKNDNSDLLGRYCRDVSPSINGLDAIRDAAKGHARGNVVMVRQNVCVGIALCELGQSLRCTTVRQETDLLSEQRCRKCNQKLIAVSTQIDRIPPGRQTGGEIPCRRKKFPDSRNVTIPARDALLKPPVCQQGKRRIHRRVWKHATRLSGEGVDRSGGGHTDHFVLCRFTYAVRTLKEANAAQSSARRLIPYFWDIDKTISSKSIESNPSPSPNNGVAGSTSWGVSSKCKVATINRAISVLEIISTVGSCSICTD